MTLTLHGGPALSAWQPMLSGQEPAVAVALPMADRLRLVLLELAVRARPHAQAIRQISRSARTLSAADLADQLVDGHLGRPRCTSVAIADLLPDGGLELQMRAAPPAMLLAPGEAPRLLAGPPAEPAHRSGLLATGDVLLLCSASFLEDPPPVLGTIRRSVTDGPGLARLRQTLRAGRHQGATASVTVPSPEHRWT